MHLKLLSEMIIQTNISNGQRTADLYFLRHTERENLGEPMHHMFRAIRRIVDETPDIKVIYPIHMNPVVRKAADEELGNDDRIRIIEPLDVLDFHNFMSRSYLILTDSGGIQGGGSFTRKAGACYA